MADEEKTEKVTIGRNVTHENVMYGKTAPGEFYMVTPSVAAALRAKNATASVASHMAAEKARADAEAASSSGEGSPSKEGVIIGGKGEGEGGGSAGEGSAAGGSGKVAGPGGKKVAVAALEGLSGELPEDFPKRAELAKGAPDADPPIPPVTRYEELTKLTADELDKIPGIGQASVEVIGQRLFADAEKAAGGGGGE